MRSSFQVSLAMPQTHFQLRCVRVDSKAMVL